MGSPHRPQFKQASNRAFGVRVCLGLAPAAQGASRTMLTPVHPAPRPCLPPQWLQGMGIPACRAATCEELAATLRAALERQGPSLIEAVL